MRTGAEFIASLDDGRRVWVGDELIEDLASHPKTKGYVEAIAKFYDLHHDPEFQDRTTFVDEAGVRRSMDWFIPSTKEELRRRRTYYETMMREVGGTSFSRMPDSSNAVLLTYIDDPEPGRRSRSAPKGGRWPKTSATNGRSSPTRTSTPRPCSSTRKPIEASMGPRPRRR